MLCFNNLFPSLGSKSRESKRLRRFVKSLFSIFLFTTLFLTFHTSVYAATYYVNNNCSSACDGTTSIKGWPSISSATNASNVPDGSTVEFVSGSGPYHEVFNPSLSQQNIIWNFNNVEVRRDVDLNQLVTDGGYSWNLSSDTNHSNYYYLTRTAPTNLVTNGTMETNTNWSDYAGVSVNERSNSVVHSGTYSRHVVANIGGITQTISGLVSGTTYRVSGWYYLVSGALLVNFFSNQPALTTTGSWQQFSYDINATATSVNIYLWRNASTEFYVDDIVINKLDGSSNPVVDPNPWGSLFAPGTNRVNTSVVDSTWSVTTTNDWYTDKWVWGDFDSLGYSTFYVKWSGGNPTGNSINVLVPIDASVSIIPVGSTGNIINNAHFISSNNVIIKLYEAANFNNSLFQYADQHAIDVGTGSGGSLGGTTIKNSKFIDCGHRGILLRLPANPLNIYNNYFDGCHLMFYNDAVNSSVVNFINNSSKNLLAGGIQWTNNTSTLNENNNQFFVNSTGIHGSEAIAFTAGVPANTSWTTTNATDLPANFTTTSACGPSTTQNCGVDPLTDSNGIPIYNSPLINVGAVIAGRTTDYLGNALVGIPDIGPYEFLLPTSPTSLSQYKSNGTTTISSGTFTNESSVTLKFNMSSSNSSDSLTPQIEIQPIGTAFTNSVTNSGSAVAYTGTAVTGTVSVTGLSSGTSYHWQARVSNSAGQGSWVSMGGNPDFKVDTSTPTSGSLLSPTNYTKDNTKPTFVFKKSTDSDSGVSSYSVSLDSGKNRSFSTSGIPANGNGTANYIWKNDSTVKIEFVNENDSDTSNDEIHVYFKDLDSNELTEGKHSWSVTTTDSQSNSTSQSADFYLDKTSPSISDLALANVSTIKSGETYKLSILNRTPSFSGLAIDLYQGSTKTNSNNSEDIFDKVSSGPQTIILTLKRQKDDKTYGDYLTKEYSLSDIQDISNDRKTSRFYVTTPFPLIDGYYQVQISLKDYAGNTFDQPYFYISIGNVLSKSLEQIFTSNLDTKITDQQTVPALTDEEKEAVKQNGYTVKIKVIDTDNKPVLGAKVTIHSKVQETTTDENGIAVFNGVEPGDHRVLIAYANYEGEQSLNLSGDVKEFSISIQVKPQSLMRNPKVITASVIAGLIIIVLVVLLIKAKRKK